MAPSLRQAVGAAPTRRLAVVRSHAPAAAAITALPGPDAVTLPSLGDAGSQRAHMTSPAMPKPPAPARSMASAVPRFSLAAIVAGDWLWLEDLGDAPLAREQVWLIRAMAHALRMKRTSSATAPPVPDIAQFDWPMHSNQQLDRGIDAAHSAVLGFLTRKCSDHRCDAIILLGDTVSDWVPRDRLPGKVVSTAGTRQMLERPVVKRSVWSDLVSLLPA